METNTLIIIIGTLFTLALILSGWVIIGVAQKHKAKAIRKSQWLEITRQKDIAENTLLSQENERQRIGMELHDDLGPTFTAINIKLKRVRNFIEDGDNSKAMTLANEAADGLTNAVDKFSEVTKVLYPVVLNRKGLKDAIHYLIVEFQTHSAIKIKSDFNIRKLKNELVKLVVYRITQEMLNNASKHSNASKIDMTFWQTEKAIHIDYTDNGIGFDSSKFTEGIGLNSMKGRVEAIHGEFNLITSAGKGLQISVSIPYV